MIRSRSMSRQQQSALAILTVVALLAVSAIVWPVWSANAAYEARVTQLHTRLEQLRSSAEAAEALRPQYEQLIRSQTSAGHHLKSDTESVAAAELQRIVKSITTSNAAQILSTQILPASEERDFVRVALRVRLRGPIGGIVQAIYDIEANSTFLFLEKLSIRDGAKRRTMRSNATNQFDADFDLIAYMPKPL